MTTYTKLRSGAWGIRAEGSVKPGQTVTVTTKAGAQKAETIDRVIWTDGKVTLASIARRDRDDMPRNGRPRGRWTGCHCGSLEDTPRPSDCASCRFDNDY